MLVVEDDVDVDDEDVDDVDVDDVDVELDDVSDVDELVRVVTFSNGKHTRPSP